MEKIRQAYVSKQVRKFKDRWFKMFNLVDYYSIYEPAVFFYNIEKDLETILKHKGKCVVVITSSHTKRLTFAARKLVKPNIKILATAKIADVLDSMDIKYEWPKHGIFVEKVSPVKLGDMIYSYMPNELYGTALMKKIRTKYKIIIGDGKIPMDEWYNGKCKDYYNKVFVGLNLSETSGGQTSVVDLGLRGIPCITNVIKMPHTISWKTIIDIENIIEELSKNIGQINDKLAKEVYESMDYEQKWLEVDR